MIHAALTAFRKRALPLLLAAATAVLPVKGIAYSPGTIERIPGTKISLPCGTVTEPGTNPHFTEASIRFYQQSQEFRENPVAREILNNPERLQAMIQGSIQEDSPEACFVRAYNHFTDWETSGGMLDFLSSRRWSQDKQAQQGKVPLDNFLQSGRAWTVPLYPLYNAVLESYQGLYPEGNHTWDKAVGEQDFESLGHLLHLLQDATVPAHVRNDPHALFPAGARYVSRTDLHEDSYEQWAQDHPEAFATLTPQELKRFNSLEEIFAEVIPFTGSHFFSDNSMPLTAEGEAPYSHPKVFPRREGGKTYYYTTVNGKEIPIARKGFLSPYILNVKVLEGQFQILGTKAVEMGAAAIDLFFRTIEAEQPQCQSHEDKICINSKVHWQDSCGQLEEVAEECSPEEYCEEGVCNSRLVEIAHLPQPRLSAFATILNNSIYYFGGISAVQNGGSSPNSNVWSFDSEQDQWVEHAPLPERLGELGGTVCKNYHGQEEVAFLFGGYFGVRFPADNKNVYIYSPLTDSWETINGDLAPGMRNHSFICRDGEEPRIFGVIDDVMRSFNPSEGKWVEEGEINPFGIGSHGGAYYHNNQWFLFDQQGITIYNFGTREWQFVSRPDFSERYYGAVWHNNNIFLIASGGLVSAYNLERDEWVQSNLPRQLGDVAYPSLVSDTPWIYLLGGGVCCTTSISRSIKYRFD